MADSRTLGQVPTQDHNIDSRPRVRDNIVQEARNVIHHLKTINDGPAARQASDQACNVIENLVTAYSRKCDDAARSEKNPACKESLQNLANENNYLRQKLAARTDTKFVKGILEHSVKNIHLVQVDSKTNLTQHCAELEKEKIGLKYEIYQLQNVLNSHYPGATTVMLYQNQLAAEVRLREYQAIQHDSMHEKMEQQSEALRKLTDVCEEFAKQNISLHTAANEKPPAPKQDVFKGICDPKTPKSPDAPNSPTIASASASEQQAFGTPTATFDPRSTLHHHHSQRAQSEVRNHHQQHVHRAGHTVPTSKAAPPAESRVVPSPEHEKSPPAEGRVVPSPEHEKSPPASKVQPSLQRVPWE